MSETTDAHRGAQPHGTNYRHVITAVTESAWAILPEKLATIVDIVSARAAGEKLSDDEIQARIGAGPASKPMRVEGPVAVLPLYGVIFPKANMMTEVSGATSIQRFQNAFRDALEDPSVASILIDVDSPGGVTDLVPELAAEIRASRGVKPIVAIANTQAGSAAYWIASQASEFVVTPSGDVGSIGVFMAHQDVSEKQRMEGVNVTAVSAGKYKVERAPFAPLTEEAVAAMQAEVDEFYGMFTTAVARGRNVGVDTVRSGFGEGRMVTAKRALDLGMVDRIETFDQTLSRLQNSKSRGRGRGATAVDVAAHAVEHDVATAGAVNQNPNDDQIAADADVGISFAGEARALRDSAEALVERARSLAEFRDRGRLTAAKREQLTAVQGSLAESAVALGELLAETDPNRHTEALLREKARFLRTSTYEGSNAA